MPGKPHPDPLYAIRRRDGPWGTVFGVQITRAGKRVYRLFRAKDYGTVAKALRAAQRWRDEQAATLKPPTKRDYCQRLKPNNTSGAPGVYFQRQVIKGTAYVVWQARSPEGGKRCKTRSFSISKYGHDEAYALAVKARAEFVAEVQGYAAINRIPEKFRPRA